MTKENEPAFPEVRQNRDMYPPEIYSIGGLTKREWFAGMAMQGMLAMRAHPNIDLGKVEWNNTARWAVKQADEVIYELSKKKDCDISAVSRAQVES